ncbi:hypothetical protein Ancab_007534 [Ancistrocladus abbreviatus]
MSTRATSQTSAMLALGLILLSLIGQCQGKLKIGYYDGKCGDKNIEEIIFRVVKERFLADPTLVAALLRMQFHDCFVRGCDASLLLDGPNSEKTAPPNGSVRGFEVIDEAKAAVEAAGGKWYEVETGRLDGRTSLASEANANLPAPTIPVWAAVQAFQKKNLTKEDFVLLLGGHTVGIAHCPLFQDRLYNFQGSHKPDPSLNATLIPKLRAVCPQSGIGASNFVPLDQTPGSAFVVDNGFYKAIWQHKGILQVDQQIAIDPLTKNIVRGLLTADFATRFGQAMVHLGRVGVLSGGQGEFRKTCRAVNVLPQSPPIKSPSV